MHQLVFGRIRSAVRLSVLVAALASGLTAGAQTAPFKEYEVKAVFLFNFAQFIEWPAKAFSGPVSPFVIGILGDDPFGTVLEDTVRGETIGDRKIVIKRSRNLADLGGCQIVFVSRSEKPRLDQILASLNETGILTISETDQFARLGGVINFITRENKVRFEINVDAAAREGLKISAKLLKVASLVTAKHSTENR